MSIWFEIDMLEGWSSYTSRKSCCLMRGNLAQTFLLFQSVDTKTWLRTLNDSRGAYSALRKHFLQYIDHPDTVASDPLGDDSNVSTNMTQPGILGVLTVLQSPWNTLRRDEEIRAEILQDIERCMPEEEFFRRAKTQRMMLDILFVYCKINQDTGYRQGMHELLAPLIRVVELDAVIVVEGESPDSDDVWLGQLLDERYIEHDAFTLLSLLMRSAKSSYELGDIEQVTDAAQNDRQQSSIIARSKRIHEGLLAQLDPELAEHLSDIEILPQIFLM